MTTKQCPDCERDIPVYEVQVREGARQRFGLHSTRAGYYCRMSDQMAERNVIGTQRRMT